MGLGKGFCTLRHPLQQQFPWVWLSSGLETLRAGLRLALGLDIPFAAVRGYGILSDSLHALGRYAEAGHYAAEGAELAVQAGMARTYGCYLVHNQAESLLCLGQWARADQVTAERLAGQPEGQFGALLRKLRAELAAMRGQYDEIDRELRAALREMSDTSDYQVAQPARYITALIALGTGDLAAARNAADAGLRLPGADLIYGARYTWPLLWLGTRAEADEADRLRARQRRVPERITARCAELARIAADLPAPSQFPVLLAYRSLVTAEHARAIGPPDGRAWAAAADAWRSVGNQYQLSYALLRLAEARLAVGDRDNAAGTLREAHAIAEQLGAAPIAADAAALARRARISLTSGPAPEREDGSPGSASPAASARSCCWSPPGTPTGKSPRPCSSARRPPACTSRTSWPNSASPAGSMRPCSGRQFAAPRPGGSGIRTWLTTC